MPATRITAHTADLPSARLRWVASVCALAIWLLGLLAASPQLHAALHDDAGAADHSCAVTLFSHGADQPAPDLSIVAAPLLRVTALLPTTVSPHVESTVDWLQPGRGPP